jgi:hypothetical protein
MARRSLSPRGASISPLSHVCSITSPRGARASPRRASPSPEERWNRRRLRAQPTNPLTVRAVNTCPFDENAILIPAWQMKAHVKKAGFRDPKIRFRLSCPGHSGASGQSRRSCTGARSARNTP